MKTCIRLALLVTVLMMCFILPAHAAASSYDEVVTLTDFIDPIFIDAGNLNKKISYEMDGKQIAEWNGQTRTFTVKGPLDISTQNGFLRFNPHDFASDQKNVTIVIDGQVSLASAAADGHLIDAWVGDPYPFEFEVNLTSTGYNSANPSASASSLSLKTTGTDSNGIQTSVLNVKDLYIKELDTNCIGMYASDRLTVSNTTIDRASSQIGSIMEGAHDNDSFEGMTLDNVTINKMDAQAVDSAAVNSPGTLTIRNSQISNLSAGNFGFITSGTITVENSDLSNASCGVHLIATESDIEIKNSTFSSFETGSSSIISDGFVSVSNSAINNATVTEGHIIDGWGSGASLNASSITNSKAVLRGAAIGASNVQIKASSITNFTGENIVSSGGNVSIQDSELSGVTTWSSVWTEGDLAISNTALSSISTEPGAPGLYTGTGNFKLNGVATEVPTSPVISIKPPVVSDPAVPHTGDNTPIALLSMLMLISLIMIIRNRKLAV